MSRVDVALSYARAGLSVLPVRGDGSKMPRVEWKALVSQPANDEQLGYWFRNGSGDWLGVVCGAVSGNLETIDFDHPEYVADWKNAVKERGGEDLLARLQVATTPRPGRHVRYRCAEPVEGNLKLASHAAGDIAIETRGESGFVCVEPSLGYKAVQHDLLTLPVITAVEREILLSAARSLTRWVQPSKTVRIAERSPDRGSRPGDHFIAQTNWAELLEPHGWRSCGTRGETELWKRPGKTALGHSATTNYAGSGLLYVFSANAAPFESEHSYDLFGAYAVPTTVGISPRRRRSSPRRATAKRLPHRRNSLERLFRKINRRVRSSPPTYVSSPSNGFGPAGSHADS